MLKVIIDTNVFISGIPTKSGNPSKILKIWKRERRYQLFITEEIIREILKVMNRLDFPLEIIKDWDRILRKNAILVIPTRKIKVIKEDPSDNKFLECAIESGADYIISGDKRLKDLGQFEEIKILSVTKFLNILKK